MEKNNQANVESSEMRDSIIKQLSTSTVGMKTFSDITQPNNSKITLKAWCRRYNKWVCIKVIPVQAQANGCEMAFKDGNKQFPHIESLKQVDSYYFQKIDEVIYLNAKNSLDDPTVCLVAIVSEFRPNADVKSYISKNTLNIDETIRLISKIIAAVKELHESYKFVHGQLKPENVLIDEQGSIKLTDYFATVAYSDSESVVEDPFSQNNGKKKNEAIYNLNSDYYSAARVGMFLCNECIESERQNNEKKRYFRIRSQPVIQLLEQLQNSVISVDQILEKLGYYFAIPISQKLGYITYEGQLNDKGKYHGKGKRTTHKQLIEFSTWENGIREGRCVIYYKDGQIYDGELKGNKLEGRGMSVFQTEDQRRYEGQYSNGQINGFGAIYSGDTDQILRGNFVRGLMQGQGYQVLSTGAIYQGGFLNSNRHGRGTYTWHNEGKQYDGMWSQNKMHGKGILTLKDGTIVQGEMQNDAWNGYAVIKYVNGMYFEGIFKNNQMHGYGTFRNPVHQSIYEGEFQNNAFNGKGKLTSANGNVQCGVFKDGCFTRPIEEEEYKSSMEVLKQRKETSTKKKQCVIF